MTSPNNEDRIAALEAKILSLEAVVETRQQPRQEFHWKVWLEKYGLLIAMQM